MSSVYDTVVSFFTVVSGTVNVVNFFNDMCSAGDAMSHVSTLASIYSGSSSYISRLFSKKRPVEEVCGEWQHLHAELVFVVVLVVPAVLFALKQ